MTTHTPQREYFFDSIRAWLMLLGVPFHLSLIYSSHGWAVNSATPSLWLTVFNDFIHAFRMQVFFVISGYFSLMLYLRYAPSHWLKMRLERVGIPMLAAIPLITLPQFFLLRAFSPKAGDWDHFTLYQKYNALGWDLISHLWFLLVLVLFTLLGYLLFRRLKQWGQNTDHSESSWTKLTLIFLTWAGMWALFRRAILLTHPALLGDGLFHFTVMQTLLYLPFFLIGALAFIRPDLKTLFLTPRPATFIGALLAFIAYLLNQRYSLGSGWLYELDAIISTLMGLWMVNVVFAFGHRFLNAHSPRITWLVNASLFIYLVHHPLTLLYGFFITPHIASNTLGFLLGLVMVFGCAFALYQLHLRVALLRFLFSGKPQRAKG
ncbi:glucans biosynthesis protein MdoC [Pantoea sp. 1.19]|uniref:glucans biosynthesis protein MdoC n=1 Tax=Pantoea sp. 1.19 TaxID=1925589 RepID=UPI0009489226|nr:glucans biosynthesis protein MdoC [Pantoea sp. 1.19]